MALTLSLLSKETPFLLFSPSIDLCQMCRLIQVNLFDDNQKSTANHSFVTPIVCAHSGKYLTLQCQKGYKSLCKGNGYVFR